MAFPLVAATGAVYSTPANAASHPLDLPAGVVEGSLLVGMVSANIISLQSTTWPAGWAKVVDDVPNGTVLAVAYKRVQAGDPELTDSTVTVTTAESFRVTGVVWRIAGHHATTPPEAATPVTGDNVNPEPPSLSPVEGGIEDRLWIAVEAADGTLSDVTAYPPDYLGNQVTQLTGTTSGTSCSFGAATRNLAAATEDPGVFTIGASRPWVASTIAIRPAAVGGGASGTGQAVAPPATAAGTATGTATGTAAATGQAQAPAGASAAAAAATVTATGAATAPAATAAGTTTPTGRPVAPDVVDIGPVVDPDRWRARAGVTMTTPPTYSPGDSLPPLGLRWLDADGPIDFATGWTFVARVGEEGEPALVTKTDGITGDDVTAADDPNVTITWQDGELDSLPPGEHTVTIVATRVTDSAQMTGRTTIRQAKVVETAP